MRGKKSCTVAIFVGLLLTVVFAVGLISDNNPAAFAHKYRYDFALDQFCEFCRNCWLPAGVIGIPTLLISLIISLSRESKEK